MSSLGDCVVCGDPVAQYRVSCGQYPTHLYCLSCFFRSWFTRLLAVVDDLAAYSSATAFVDFLTTHNVQLLGAGEYVGTPGHDDSVLCDLCRFPLRCWLDETPLSREQLYQLFLHRVRQDMLPPDCAYLDRCCAFYRHLYSVNEATHRDNRDDLTALLLKTQLLSKRLEDKDVVICSLERALVHLKLLLSVNVNVPVDVWDRVVNHMFMLAKGDLSVDHFEQFMNSVAPLDQP